MIYQINKYHKTEAGEVSSIEKVEKSDPIEAYERACEAFYGYAKNYMADKSVLAWNMTIIQPSDMTQKKHDSYVRPTVEPVVEE